MKKTHLATLAFGAFMLIPCVKGSEDEREKANLVECQLSADEHREFQALLDARLAREREYRESVLAMQAAQARLEAANSAAEARFYKLCAIYKLDPETHQLTPDAKGIALKSQKTADTEKR